MKVVCIGLAVYDITIPYKGYPIENTKNRVDTIIECGGGPASNAAYLLGKWGVDTTFIGVVGNDLYGNKIKKEFDDIGVNTHYLELNEEKTATAYIISNSKKGSRTIFTHKNNTKLSDFELDFEPDYILTDGQEYKMSEKLIKKYPNAITIIDASRPQKEIIKLAKMCKHLVCSKEFAEAVAGMKIRPKNNKNLTKLYNKLEKEFNNNVVVTLESKGCLYAKDGKVMLMPSLQVKAVDSTGAGDIYHGAFVYGLVKDYKYEDTIKLSNIAGALSVTKLGGRYSVPTKEEMKEYFYEFK